MNDREKRIIKILFNVAEKPTLIYERPDDEDGDVQTYIYKKYVDFTYEVILWHPVNKYQPATKILASNVDLERLAQSALEQGRQDLIDQLKDCKRKMKEDLKKIKDLPVLDKEYTPWYGGI